MPETTEEKVKRLIAEQLMIDTSEITPSATLEDLGADSLDKVELVMLLEEQFDIEINDDDAEKLTSLPLVVEYVGKRI